MDKPLPEWVEQAVPYEYGEVMRSVWLAGARLVLDRMEAENEALKRDYAEARWCLEYLLACQLPGDASAESAIARARSLLYPPKEKP